MFSSPIVLVVKLKEYPKGKQLAEEFEDYLALIEICDELKDVEQLRTYIEQFRDKVKNKLSSFDFIACDSLVYGYIR